MNLQLLIDAIVRQTTILIAELATAGGARAPLAHVANQVFLDLAAELERQGVSRRISADMFGIALRSYQRKIARLRESSTDRGRSLWTVVYEYLATQTVATRSEIQKRFEKDDEELVGGVLHDLTESGVVFASGRGPNTAYRVVTSAELERIAVGDDATVDAMVWALVYREGPVSVADLARHGSAHAADVAASVERLVQAGRIEATVVEGVTRYASAELVIPKDAKAGWEAAVFDHFQALVKTVVMKLRHGGEADWQGLVGGSTYTFLVWPGHPFYEEVVRELADFRARKTDLRNKVDAHNAEQGIRERHRKIVCYYGQCALDEGLEEES